MIDEIRNKHLVCHNCIYAYDDTLDRKKALECEVYTEKPVSILHGGRCGEKEVERWQITHSQR